jgi:orotate phosphoribosyltransferase
MSDNALMELLIDAGAIKQGHFVLSSGRHSDRYIEKFDIIRDPVTTSRMLADAVPEVAAMSPDVVVGPTTGGIILAFELARQLGVRSAYAEREANGSNDREIRRGTTFIPGSRVVVIDDILTTGGSILETLAALSEHPVEVVGIVVMVDRSNGRTAFGDIPLLPLVRMEVRSWSDPENCPLCLTGEPLTKPGTTQLPGD